MSGAAPERVRCAIVGGGPAGVMLGLLLARAGVQVTVLEKHKDFLRDFRGDTVHPSTLDVIAELGLLDEFLKRPHQEIVEIAGTVGERQLRIGSFAHAPTRCHFLALMPQWDFLDFLAGAAARYPGFALRHEAEVTGLIEEQDRILGVSGQAPDGPFELRADLVIGADGRHSVVRERAGLSVEVLGAPMDVLWMRISKRPGDPEFSLGRVNYGLILVTLDRGDYWQCAFIIRKGRYDELRAEGLAAFHEEVVRIAPFLADRVAEIDDWDKVSLLTVAVDRLRRWWRPGLLCIGDAAHAMSPIGGIGINLALQDAVAAANLLAVPLRDGTLADRDLEAVQQRRQFPTRITQAGQILIQNQVIDRVLGNDRPITPPWPLLLLDRCAWLRRIPGRLIGVGVRPEHVKSPSV